MSDLLTLQPARPPNDWVSSIKANDDKALRLLYVENYPKVKKYILHNSGSEDDAKDIYQEAFLAAWRNVQLDKFTALHEDSINNYLFQVAKNKWLDALRTQKRKKTSLVSEMEIAEMPDLILTEEENYMEKIKSHFTAMGEPCKGLLQKFYFKKENLRQIADFFSWTEATAKNNKYRCLQKLRKAVLNDK